MNLIKLEDIFDAEYGVCLAFNSMTISDDGIPFVSRREKNNGVVARVKEVEGITPNPPHTLSVAVSGSVLATFYQAEPYYSAYHVFCLSPKEEMSVMEMLTYSKIINSNKYKYSYGRQANRTLKELLIPDRKEINILCNGFSMLEQPSKEPFSQAQISLEDRTWQWFLYEKVFDIKGGYYNKKPEASADGAIPFIGATEYNNGVASWHDIKDIEATSKSGGGKNHSLKAKIFSGGKYITVSNNGSVGYAFYQPHDFTCTHDVNPITTKNIEMNAYIAMFISTLIELERYRWAYGRKWRPIRMPMSKIKLPVDNNGEPDWQFMEDYIKSLPYSSNLEIIDNNEKEESNKETPRAT